MASPPPGFRRPPTAGGADAVRQPEAPLDPITLVGLVFESSVGLRRTLEPTLQCLCGPSAPWFEVLIRLARSPGGRLRMSDLAAQTSLTPSGLTRAVDRLVEQGLVVRETCDADRRGSFAALTAGGRAAMDHALPKHERFLSELLAGVFEPEEEKALIALLRKLRDHVHPGAAAAPGAVTENTPTVKDAP